MTWSVDIQTEQGYTRSLSENSRLWDRYKARDKPRRVQALVTPPLKPPIDEGRHLAVDLAITCLFISLALSKLSSKEVVRSHCCPDPPLPRREYFTVDNDYELLPK